MHPFARIAGLKRLPAALFGRQSVQNPARPRFRHCGAPLLLVCCAAQRNKGNDMKRLSIFLAATTLLALAGCGSRTANNSAAINTANDVYDVAPDSMTANDVGNASGNATSGNATSGNASSTASNASGNSH
jgi:hypothetical protein